MALRVSYVFTYPLAFSFVMQRRIEVREELPHSQTYFCQRKSLWTLVIYRLSGAFVGPHEAVGSLKLLLYQSFSESNQTRCLTTSSLRPEPTTFVYVWCSYMCTYLPPGRKGGENQISITYYVWLWFLCLALRQLRSNVSATGGTLTEGDVRRERMLIVRSYVLLFVLFLKVCSTFFFHCSVIFFLSRYEK